MKRTLIIFVSLALLAGCSDSDDAHTFKGKTLGEWRELAKAENLKTRGDAAVALLDAGNPADVEHAVNVLIEVVRKGQPTDAMYASYKLAQLGPPAAPALPAIKERRDRIDAEYQRLRDQVPVTTPDLPTENRAQLTELEAELEQLNESIDELESNIKAAKANDV